MSDVPDICEEMKTDEARRDFGLNSMLSLFGLVGCNEVVDGDTGDFLTIVFKSIIRFCSSNSFTELACLTYLLGITVG